MNEKYLLTKNENTVTILKKDDGWNYKKEFGSTIIENFDISNDKLDGMLLELKNFGYNIIAQPKSITIIAQPKSITIIDYTKNPRYYPPRKPSVNFLPFQHEYHVYYRQVIAPSARTIQSTLCKHCISYIIKEGVIEAHVKNKNKQQILLKQLKPNLPLGVLLEIHVHEE